MTEVFFLIPLLSIPNLCKIQCRKSLTSKFVKRGLIPAIKPVISFSLKHISPLRVKNRIFLKAITYMVLFSSTSIPGLSLSSASPLQHKLASHCYPGFEVEYFWKKEKSFCILDGCTENCSPISERYPLLITKPCLCIHFYDEFWRKTTHFKQFL